MKTTFTYLKTFQDQKKTCLMYQVGKFQNLDDYSFKFWQTKQVDFCVKKFQFFDKIRNLGCQENESFQRGTDFYIIHQKTENFNVSSKVAVNFYSAGDNWKAFFGYVMEFDFFNSEKPADKITSRLLVSFPEGLQSEEEFTNSVPCIRTPKEYRYS